MPIYPIKCDNQACGHTGEEYARMSECEQIRCPVCAGPTTRIPSVPRDGNRRFAGRESYSVMEGWAKSDVPEARKLMGNFGHCIDDTGRVKFSDRKEQIGYVRQLEAVESASGINEDPDPD
jgi:hypothetical protein